MKRILFVDDEPRILSGIQRMLRGMRHDWEMEFVGSGAAALELLAQRGFDVVVTDMRMPEMDGASLLEEVRSRHPEVVRLVLSGYADEPTAMRAASSAHQYLPKPCDPALLQRAIQRTCLLQDLLGDEAMRQIIGSADVLPTCPRTYTAIERALRDPEFDLPEISRIISADPSLSASVLKLVNSAFFGCAQEVHTIAAAVNYLGAKTMRNLALSVEVFQRTSPPMVPEFSMESIQRHSWLVASLAGKIERPEHSECAFLAGLLHELGSIVLASRVPDSYAACQAQAVAEGRPMYSVERDLLGFDHSAVGGYVLGLWGFPLGVVEAVAFHHGPMMPSHLTTPLLGSVHLADGVVAEVEGRTLDCAGLPEHSESREVYPVPLAEMRRLAASMIEGLSEDGSGAGTGKDSEEP